MSTASRQQPSAGIRARLLNRGAYRWYLGTIFGLVYQASEIVYVWTSAGSLAMKIAATVVLSVFYLGYVVIGPLVWPESVRFRVTAATIYWLASFVLILFVGPFVVWVWILVIAIVTFLWVPLAPTLILSAAVVVAQVLLGWSAGFANGLLFAPLVTVTVLIWLLSITRQIDANRKLRDAQATIGSLAAAEERARLARDLHDVLGHSLTVVAVKSELAGRLVTRDPEKAIAEIADIERLSRTALADLRAAVSSYREMNLDAELSAARTALDAAGITAHLPVDGDAADDELRPLFSWVLREGVTNVIRHSGARQCWVEIDSQTMRIRDDGAGAPSIADVVARGSAGSHGNGLIGLQERASAAGAVISALRISHGFVLTVTRTS